MAETLHAKKANPVTGGATVNAASKMPFDFTLRIYDFIERHEPVMGGGTRKYSIAERRRGAPEFIVRGNAYAQNVGPLCDIKSGFAITRGIPKDFWDEWLSQNQEADYVINGMIFAQETYASVVDEALDKESLKSGLERLDPAKPIKLGRGPDVRKAS